MVCPRFLISRNERGPRVCSVSLLNNCSGKGWLLAIRASNSIHIGWHRLKQEQMPRSMYVSVLVIWYPKTPDVLPGTMQAVLPQILILVGRQDAGRNNMMLMCFPVGITKDRGSFGGLCLYLCREGGFQERNRDLGNKRLVVRVLNGRWMDTHLSCVTYSYVSVLCPGRSWYLRGRAEAALATSPRCSKAWRQAEFYARNFDQQWPFKAERGVQHGHCPVQIKQPREL